HTTSDDAPARLEDRWATRALAPVPGEPGRDKGECAGQRHVETIAVMSSPYDAIAELYDPWSASVVEDVGFYLDEARREGGPVVELGVGTGRIAVPIARKGIRVIGVDSSREMLAACRRRAQDEGVTDLVDLRLGDLRDPPIEDRVPLVICPFRSYLHLADDGERVDALTAAHAALLPSGRLVFDVFVPKPDDIAETHGR